MGKKVKVVVVVVVVVVVTAVVVEILTFSSPVHASASLSTLEMRSCYFVTWLRKLLVLMGPEGLLPWLQEPSYGPYSDPYEPIACLCTLFAYITILFFQYFPQNDTFPSG